MIDKIEQRINHWDNAFTVTRQGPSIPDPYTRINEWRSIFSNKSVLEIGPGEGRQLNDLKPLSSEYVVADISQEALNKLENTQGHLIKDYTFDLNRTFDVVSFWYVWHHIKRDEIDDFIALIKRHLNPKGSHIFFNFSYLGQFDNGDGIHTTAWNLKEVVDILFKHNITIRSYLGLDANCHVVLAHWRKMDDDLRKV